MLITRNELLDKVIRPLSLSQCNPIDRNLKIAQSPEKERHRASAPVYEALHFDLRHLTNYMDMKMSAFLHTLHCSL